MDLSSPKKTTNNTYRCNSPYLKTSKCSSMSK